MELLIRKRSENNTFSIIVLLLVLIAFFLVVAIVPKLGLAGSIVFIITLVSLRYRDLPFYLLIALFPLLPMYFAIDIGSSFPLLTFYRLIAIFFISFEVLFNGRRDKHSLAILFKEIKLNKYIIIYLLIAVLGTVYSLNGESIKSVIATLIENILVFYMIIGKIKNFNIFNKAIKVFITAALIISILGIIESISGFNFFSLLDMNVREGIIMDAASYIRMNSNRIETSFGHPLGYGLYLVLAIPIVMYKMMQKDKLAVITFGFLVTNLLLTISRGPILAFVISMIFFFIFSSKKIKVRSLCTGIALLLMISGYAYISNSSTANTIKNIPIAMIGLIDNSYKVDNFGENENPFGYRLYIIRLTLNTIKDDFIFGKGRGFFRYNYIPGVDEVGSPKKITSIDNYYLCLLIEIGVLGTGTIVLLQIKFILLCLFDRPKGRKLSESFNFYVFLSLLAYYLTLTTVAALNTERIVWMIYALLISYLYVSKKEQLAETSGLIADRCSTRN